MKAIKYFAFMMLAMTFALGFSACSDDDDKDDEDVVNNDGLVGTWVEDDSDNPYILTFSSNHTGTIEFEVNDENYSRAYFGARQQFKWKTSEKNGDTCCEILTTGGDYILDDGTYKYILIGNSMNFGNLRFSRR
ncbi:MAG: hypothetical protein ACI30K_06770 [Muribaculaceae bacterium]